MEYAFGFLHSASKIGESSGNTVINQQVGGRKNNLGDPPSKKWSL